MLRCAQSVACSTVIERLDLGNEPVTQFGSQPGPGPEWEPERQRVPILTVEERAIESARATASGKAFVRFGLAVGRHQIGSVSIILPSNADQSEKGIAARIGEGRSQRMQGRRFGNRAVRTTLFLRAVIPGPHKTEATSVLGK
jgi:hypothetical protein